MTRAQTVMDLLGSLHTLRLDSAWMMRLPVARNHVPLSRLVLRLALLRRLCLALDMGRRDTV